MILKRRKNVIIEQKNIENIENTKKKRKKTFFRDMPKPTDNNVIERL